MKDEKGFKTTEIGMIPEDWEIGCLGDFCSKIGSGFTPRGAEKVYKESGVVLIRSQNVYNNSFSKDGLVYLDESTASDMENVTVEKDDVLLNITGDSVARCCTVPEEILPARVNQHVSIIRTDREQINPIFLRYYLTSPRMQTFMLSLAESGGTRNALTKGMIEGFLVPKPTKEEQASIVGILSDLDSKVMLNRQMDETLEAIAQATFRRWFIDFEFPNEVSKPYRSSGGEMFYNEELEKEIPKGWGIGNLSETGIIVCGKTPPKMTKEFFGGKILFIKIPDMHNQTFVITTEDSLTKEGQEFQANKTIPPGSLCVSCIATVGLVSITCRESQTNQQINSIIPKSPRFCFYLYFILKSMRKYLEDLGSGGSATLNINTNTFSNIRILIPSDSVLDAYHRLVSPVFQRILSNLVQSQTLSQTRNILLPKLMSGKIRIPVEVR